MKCRWFVLGSFEKLEVEESSTAAAAAAADGVVERLKEFGGFWWCCKWDNVLTLFMWALWKDSEEMGYRDGLSCCSRDGCWFWTKYRARQVDTLVNCDQRNQMGFAEHTVWDYRLLLGKITLLLYCAAIQWAARSVNQWRGRSWLVTIRRNCISVHLWIWLLLQVSSFQIGISGGCNCVSSGSCCSRLGANRSRNLKQSWSSLAPLTTRTISLWQGSGVSLHVSFEIACIKLWLIRLCT